MTLKMDQGHCCGKHSIILMDHFYDANYVTVIQVNGHFHFQYGYNGKSIL